MRNMLEMRTRGLNLCSALCVQLVLRIVIRMRGCIVCVFSQCCLKTVFFKGLVLGRTEVCFCGCNRSIKCCLSLFRALLLFVVSTNVVFGNDEMQLVFQLVLEFGLAFRRMNCDL